MSDDRSIRTATVQTTMILTGALVGGVGLFALVVAFLTSGNGAADAPGGAADPGGPIPPGLALPLAIGAPFVAIAAALIVRRMPRRSAPGDERAGAQEFTMRTILSLAIVEGAGLLACVLALIDRDPTLLAGAAVAVVGMLAFAPTSSRLDAFLDG